MALINCENCGHKISDSAKKCPHCDILIRPLYPLYSLFQEYDNLLFFDLETSGIDSKENNIIEFAALNVTQIDGIAFVCKETDVLVQLPNNKLLDKEVENLTGITNRMLNQEGIPYEALIPVVESCVFGFGKTLMIAHNAQFDMNFLKELFLGTKHQSLFEKLDVLDSLTVCRDRFAYPHKLTNAIDIYNLSEYVQNTHRGIDDVYALFAVTKALSDEFDDLKKYINLFGYNPKYGITGDKINHVKYLPQGFNGVGKLYKNINEGLK